MTRENKRQRFIRKRCLRVKKKKKRQGLVEREVERESTNWQRRERESVITFEKLAVGFREEVVVVVVVIFFFLCSFSSSSSSTSGLLLRGCTLACGGDGDVAGGGGGGGDERGILTAPRPPQQRVCQYVEVRFCL